MIMAHNVIEKRRQEDDIANFIEQTQPNRKTITTRVQQRTSLVDEYHGCENNRSASQREQEICEIVDRGSKTVAY